MQAKTIKNTLLSKLLVAVLAVSLVFTMMPLATGAAYAEQTEWNDSDIALVVGETQLYKADVTALEAVTAGEGNLSVKGVKLSTLFETYLGSSTKPKVTINTADIGETPDDKTQLIAEKAAIGDYILAYEAGGKPIFQTSSINPNAVGCFNLYDPNNLLNDQGNKLKTVLKMPAVIIDGGSGTGGGGGNGGQTTDDAKVLVKGNVLEKEVEITAQDLEKIGESTATFTGIKQKADSEDMDDEVTGVTIQQLLDYVGVKKGATIEKFKTTPVLEYQPEFPAEWLLGDPVAIEGATWGKAMLTFKGSKPPRIYLGAFEGMNPKKGPSSAASPHQFPAGTLSNNPYCVSNMTELEVIGTVTEPAPAPAVQDGQKATVSGSTYTVTSAAAGTATFTKSKKGKTATVPATVKVNGVTLKVTGIAPKAFKGTKTKTLVVKTKGLTKKSVKGSLKGSKVKTVKVKVGSKKVNKQYVKKYKKIFTKKNAGKKVKVKR